MRHISILIAILSITVSANAALQIGVDGVMNPGEVSLLPSDLATISIVTDSVIYEAFYGLLGVPEGEPGSLAWGEFPPIIQPYVSIIPGPEPPIPGFSSWVEFYVFPEATVPPDIILIDGIQFHCEGPGDVHLTLLTTQDYAELVLNDVQLIHQIPEPGTVLLLGLGVMLLKRRR
jgi:hypothetical protein